MGFIFMDQLKLLINQGVKMGCLLILTDIRFTLILSYERVC